MQNKLIIAGSIGGCVHVAGIIHFLNLAQDEGFETLFLGPAIEIDDLMAVVAKRQPYLVSIGYRLTPENVSPLIEQIIAANDKLVVQPKWVFGGTRPVAELAKKFDFFDKVYDGSEDIDDTIAYFRNADKSIDAVSYADDLIDRIGQKHPYPLLRHHFGLPNYEETCRGIKTIAQSKILDIISLGPDQNTQQFFFHPELKDPLLDGAGGVPIRSKEEFVNIKKQTAYGNHPLIRCYSGTADVFEMAELLKETIHNAWCAVPLCWYNELDGRGTRPVEQSIKESQQLMQWHGERGIPVEINEPHHWALRDAHDVMAVVMAFISAYNAKCYGVRDYIAQMMFNVPGSLSFSMDLAKALAQIELIEELADEYFHIYRQTRAGLPFLSSDLDAAKGQLAASTYLQLAVKPHIIHVVGYSEAEYAATPEVVIESCKIVRGVIRSALHEAPDAVKDVRIQERKAELKNEALYLINFIRKQYATVSADPLADAAVLSDCIQRGIIDAPHIVKNDKFRGLLKTRIEGGKCIAYDVENACAMNEATRLKQLALNGRFDSAIWHREGQWHAG